MQSAPKPDNEPERLAALRDLAILDTLEERAYDDLTRLAAIICGTPIALVSLVDEDRQWFKSHHGLAARETPRDLAFCAHAILESKPFIVNDALADSRFADNPLVTSAPNVRFYAGVPLGIDADLRLGTLCVIAHEPRELDPEAEAALAALGRQVESQLLLRRQVRDLSRLDRMKDEFISLTSHELRTPLTSVYGGLALLRSGKIGSDPQRRATLIETAYRNAERMLALVNEMLDLSKIESGQFEVQCENVDLGALVKHEVELSDGFVAQCAGSLRFVPCDRPLMVSVDPARVAQIVSNLLSNAAKFSPDGSEVTLTVEPSEGGATVRVADRGAGVSAEFADRLFTKFAQQQGGTEHKMPGTGLGLYLCKRLAELMGGTIVYAPRDGGGSVFSLELPLA